MLPTSRTTVRPDGRRRRAFTLIELIVVVIIIAILAAIAGVAYNTYVDNTRQTAIEADAKQTDLAITARSAQDDKTPSVEVAAAFASGATVADSTTANSAAFATYFAISYDTTHPLVFTPDSLTAPTTVTVALGSRAECLTLGTEAGMASTITAGACAVPVPTPTSSSTPTASATPTTVPACPTVTGTQAVTTVATTTAYTSAAPLLFTAPSCGTYALTEDLRTSSGYNGASALAYVSYSGTAGPWVFVGNQGCSTSYGQECVKVFNVSLPAGAILKVLPSSGLSVLFPSIAESPASEVAVSAYEALYNYSASPGYHSSTTTDTSYVTPYAGEFLITNTATSWNCATTDPTTYSNVYANGNLLGHSQVRNTREATATTQDAFRVYLPAGVTITKVTWAETGAASCGTGLQGLNVAGRQSSLGASFTTRTSPVYLTLTGGSAPTATIPTDGFYTLSTNATGVSRSGMAFEVSTDGGATYQRLADLYRGLDWQGGDYAWSSLSGGSFYLKAGTMVRIVDGSRLAMVGGETAYLAGFDLTGKGVVN